MSQPIRKPAESRTYLPALCLLCAAACSAPVDSTSLGTPSPGTTDVSSGNEPGEDLTHTTGVDPAPAAPPPSPTSTSCLKVVSDHNATSTYHTLWTYDPVARVISQAQTDEHGTPNDTADPNQNHSLYWKLDAANQVVVYAGGGSGHRPFRQNTPRDEHENVVSSRAANFDALNLDDDDAGDEYGLVTYANEYDAAGLLIKRTARDRPSGTSTSTTFEHDDAGRCQVITVDGGSVERREYNDAGQLARRVQTGITRGGYPGKFDSTLEYTHDAQGRLTLVTESYAGIAAAPVERLALEYRADGSVVAEAIIDTDVSDGYQRSEWSAACAPLIPLIIQEPSLACNSARAVRMPGNFWIP